MSTPLLSPNRFANLQASLAHHAFDNWTPYGCSVLNGEILRALGVNPFGEEPVQRGGERIKEIVFDWQRLNYNAHVARYDHVSPPAPSPTLPRGEVLSAPALCKALRALRYNCDGGEATCNETQRESFRVLGELIEVLKDHCLELLPEYHDAEWAI